MPTYRTWHQEEGWMTYDRHYACHKPMNSKATRYRFPLPKCHQNPLNTTIRQKHEQNPTASSHNVAISENWYIFLAFRDYNRTGYKNDLYIQNNHLISIDSTEWLHRYLNFFNSIWTNTIKGMCIILCVHFTVLPYFILLVSYISDYWCYLLY